MKINCATIRKNKKGESKMLYFLLMISTLTATGKSVLFKKIGVSSETKKQFFTMNAWTFVFAAVTELAVIGFNFKNLVGISRFSFLMSILFAATVILTYLTQMKALSTMIIYSLGFLIPIFYGVIFLDERVSLIQILAILLLIFALILIIKPEGEKKLSLKWIIFSLLAMSGSGFTAVWQKIHQASPYADEFTLLLSWEFIFAALVLTVISLAVKKEKGDETPKKNLKVVALINGIFIGILNMLNLMLAGKLPAVVLFPVYNIGSIVLSGIICAFMFKEKTSKREIAGFVIGLVAILLIGLF